LTGELTFVGETGPKTLINTMHIHEFINKPCLMQNCMLGNTSDVGRDGTLQNTTTIHMKPGSMILHC